MTTTAAILAALMIATIAACVALAMALGKAHRDRDDLAFRLAHADFVLGLYRAREAEAARPMQPSDAADAA
jgi:uncharacterized membrane protein